MLNTSHCERLVTYLTTLILYPLPGPVLFSTHTVHVFSLPGGVFTSAGLQEVEIRVKVCVMCFQSVEVAIWLPKQAVTHCFYSQRHLWVSRAHFSAARGMVSGFRQPGTCKGKLNCYFGLHFLHCKRIFWLVKHVC